MSDNKKGIELTNPLIQDEEWTAGLQGSQGQMREEPANPYAALMDDSDDDDQADVAYGGVLSTRNLTPKSRKHLKSMKKEYGGILGNFALRGAMDGSEVTPPDINVSYVAVSLIVIPSFFVIGFTIIQVSDNAIVSVLLEIGYAFSLMSSLRLLFKCAYAEPGVIPAVQAEEIDYNIVHKCEYLEESRREFRSTNVEHFYEKRKFKYSTATGPLSETYPLTLCTTCHILRPPRSFHCKSCGVCIEEQDHHCPWMGTCIGRRNLHLFLSFLWVTGLHAFITLALTAVFFQKFDDLDLFEKQNPTLREKMHIANAAVASYCAMIGFTLFAFATYSTLGAISNVTSNENIRHRWNSEKQSRDARRVVQATRFQKQHADEEAPLNQSYQFTQEHSSQILREHQLSLSREPTFSQKLRYIFSSRERESYLRGFIQLFEQDNQSNSAKLLLSPSGKPQATSDSNPALKPVDNAAVLKDYGITLPKRVRQSSETTN